jgi:hypothetical protein
VTAQQRLQVLMHHEARKHLPEYPSISENSQMMRVTPGSSVNLVTKHFPAG